MRTRLPEVRQGITHKANIGGTIFFLTVNCFPDGTPGEVFCKTASGSDEFGLQGWTDTVCRFVSLALQSDDYGVKGACAHLIGADFKPSGPTGESRIGIAKSFPDYLARFILAMVEDNENEKGQHHAE